MTAHKVPTAAQKVAAALLSIPSSKKKPPLPSSCTDCKTWKIRSRAQAPPTLNSQAHLQVQVSYLIRQCKKCPPLQRVIFRPLGNLSPTPRQGIFFYLYFVSLIFRSRWLLAWVSRSIIVVLSICRRRYHHIFGPLRPSSDWRRSELRGEVPI
jgi:hypothetical protein